MKKLSAEKLIEDLLANPSKFIKEEKSHDLLTEFYNGLSIETLRALINDNNKLVRREAVWIASELSEDASSLIDDIIPLLHDADKDTQFYALGAVADFSNEKNIDKYVYVIQAMESDNASLRIYSVSLISNASTSKLEAVMHLFVEGNNMSDKKHKEGLSILVERRFDYEQTQKMLDDDNPIIRKYGAIIATKLYPKFPELMKYASLSSDPDIKEYAQIELKCEEID